MTAHPRSSLAPHVASGPSIEDAERLRKFGWVDAEPQHFSLPTADPRLTAQEFDWLRRIGNRLWGQRGK